MRPALLTFMLLAVCPGHLRADDTPVRLCEAWQSEYSGQAATGAHVIGLWNFNADGQLKDSSENGKCLEWTG